MNVKFSLKGRLLCKGRVYWSGLRKGQYLYCTEYNPDDNIVKVLMDGGAFMWMNKNHIEFVNEKNWAYKNQDIQAILEEKGSAKKYFA